MGSLGGGDQTPPPTAQEIALADVSKKQYDFQQENFRPLEDALLKGTAATPEARASAKGQASADAAQAFQGNAVSRNAIANQGLAAGQAKGAAVAGADQAVLARETQGKLAFSSLGNNVARNATLGLMSATSRATQTAIQKAKIAQGERETLSSGVAAGFGAYAQYSGMFDTSSSTRYIRRQQR